MAKTIRAIMEQIVAGDANKAKHPVQPETPLGPREGWKDLHEALTGENAPTGPKKPGGNGPANP